MFRKISFGYAQQSRWGFTLIELLIAISIVAILATIGFSAYSQSQLRARDAKRKQDLRALKVALELYYQRNQRYPCAGWRNSNATSGASFPLISDKLPSGTIVGCGDTNESLVPVYISDFPKDPINTGTQPWSEGHLVYGYRAYEGAPQCYVLIAELENRNDPDRIELNNKAWCGGGNINPTVTTSNYKFVIAP